MLDRYMSVPRCLSIATSDSSGGAGMQADLKAFAAAGCYGTSVVVALTAQNTTGVMAVHEVPAAFIRAQLDAVFDDIGADSVKTGALMTESVVSTVADALGQVRPLLVVDPVLAASTGAPLLTPGGTRMLIERLLPLAAVVTPNLDEARILTGSDGARRELAERLVALGARAAIVTGGHGDPIDHLFDGHDHVEIPVSRLERRSTHGSGCTHSATLAAELAKGISLGEAARIAAATSASAIAHGLEEIGAGDGPVDALHARARRSS
jgi:hydroxymethylpyrimidine/phosphomethylpyrimidine kinase